MTTDLEKLAREVMEMIWDRNGQTHLYGQKDIENALKSVSASATERTARRCAEIAADDSWIEDNIKKEFSL